MSLEEQAEPLFQARDSLLTDWKDSKVCENYRTIYRISSLILFYFLVRWAVIDLWWRKNQNVVEYLEIIWMGFDGIPQLILIWIVMSFAVLLVYPGFRLWFWCRKYCSIKRCYCGHLFIIIYSLYQLSLLTGFTKFWNFPLKISFLDLLKKILTAVGCSSYLWMNLFKLFRADMGRKLCWQETYKPDPSRSVFYWRLISSAKNYH